LATLATLASLATTTLTRSTTGGAWTTRTATETTTSTHHGSHVDFKLGTLHVFQLLLLPIRQHSHRCVAGFFASRFHLFTHGFKATTRTTSTWGTRSGCSTRSTTATWTAATEAATHFFEHLLHFGLVRLFRFVQLRDLLVRNLQLTFDVICLQKGDDARCHPQLQGNLVQTSLLGIFQQSIQDVVSFLAEFVTLLLHVGEQLRAFFFRHVLHSFTVRTLSIVLFVTVCIQSRIDDGRLSIVNLQFRPHLLDTQQASPVEARSHHAATTTATEHATTKTTAKAATATAALATATLRRLSATVTTLLS
jgi:hypothetical protein